MTPPINHQPQPAIVERLVAEPVCPHCDCRLKPERIKPGVYLCDGCSRYFDWPPKLR